MSRIHPFFRFDVAFACGRRITDKVCLRLIQTPSAASVQRPTKGKGKAAAPAAKGGAGPSMYELKEDVRFSHNRNALADMEKQEKLRKVRHHVEEHFVRIEPPQPNACSLGT